MALVIAGAGCAPQSNIAPKTPETAEPAAVDSAMPVPGLEGAVEVTEAVVEIPIAPVDGAAGNKAGAADAVTVDVSGINFAFAPKEIKVKKGQTVTINFISDMGFHDLVIDELNVRTPQLKAPGTGSVTFVADKAGIFEYYCSVGQHRVNGMVGKLIVE